MQGSRMPTHIGYHDWGFTMPPQLAFAPLASANASRMLEMQHHLAALRSAAFMHSNMTCAGTQRPSFLVCLDHVGSLYQLSTVCHRGT